MNEYIIKDINTEGYDRFLLWLSFESFADHLGSIEKAPNMVHSSGKILIDQLFLTGDGDNRFISCDFKDGRLDFRTARIVAPASILRKVTVQWLHENYNYVENSILTDSQRQKIKAGMTF